MASQKPIPDAAEVMEYLAQTDPPVDSVRGYAQLRDRVSDEEVTSTLQRYHTEDRFARH